MKTSRVAPDKTSRWSYGQCLASLLRRYKLRTTYVLTKHDAEELLRNLDKLCHEVKKKKSAKPPRKQPPFEKMVLISFYLPPAELRRLDEYAREKNMSRSAVVRYAITEMLEKMKELTPPPTQVAPW